MLLQVQIGFANPETIAHIYIYSIISWMRSKRRRLRRRICSRQVSDAEKDVDASYVVQDNFLNP